MALVTCVAVQGFAWRPAALEKWTVTIRTSGGFVGHGLGGIVAMFDARAGTGRVIRPCRRLLTPAELEPLARAVAEAKPATWAPSYVRPANPDGCCDQFRYSLTLEMQQGGGTPAKHTTFWYSEMSEDLPDNVRRLFDAAWAMKKEADARCKAR
jgi:hypothetical protein